MKARHQLAFGFRYIKGQPVRFRDARNEKDDEAEDLLIDSQGKYPGYNYYRVAGMAIDGKNKGDASKEEPPVDVKSLLP